MKIKELHSVFQEFAPFSLQESYDNSGLQIGDFDDEISAILCTIDITEEVIEEAHELGVDCIISHHPLIFKKLSRISSAHFVERCVRKAIQYNIAIYCVHTNIDMISGGVNSKIASKLGLHNTRILAPEKEQLCKIVSYVPHSHASLVKEVMAEAGAGHIGNYDSCSFTVRGEGQFRALENTQAFVGEPYKIHTEQESRIEMLCPVYAQQKVISALLAHHPYEEVAYDIFLTENTHPSIGAGMIGEFSEPISVESCVALLKKTFSVPYVKLCKSELKKVSKVAVCGGSGSFLISQAQKQGADIFITADVKYHDFFLPDNKMIIADVGHYESEQFTKEIFYDLVMKNFPKFATHFSQVNTNPIKYL
ncbi:MAG: Nif3-like dinuclear metal center hexameric protein [Bacteroidales bacterium]|jgi:dinuclear metal center YbgI/SA1388 family protein|nr:Nif3-like dinuclear metal center hexameric protein [Bacteroidales bacterium]